jgi:hypothetical protein
MIFETQRELYLKFVEYAGHYEYLINGEYVVENDKSK